MINGVYLEGLLPGLNPLDSARPGRRPERTQASLWRVYNIYKSEGTRWDEGINTPISFCPFGVFSSFLLVYGPRGDLPPSESAAQLLNERHKNSEVVCLTSVHKWYTRLPFIYLNNIPCAVVFFRFPAFFGQVLFCIWEIVHE